MATIAVIKTGGKQYKVQKGDKVKLEKVKGKEGDSVEFKDVLLIADDKGKEVEIGQPFLKGKKVEGKILVQGKDKKITVVKYKNKTRYKKTTGHRQQVSIVEITNV